MVVKMEKPMSRVFNYSLDWRFLLPSDDAGKIRVVLEEDTDLSEALERVGIPIANQFSFSDINQNERNSAESLVIPFGLPVRWVGPKQEDQIEFYRSIQRLVGPSGYLLMGFNNSLDFRSKTQSNYHSSTPRRVAYQLKQAGFKSIRIFGAIPNLSIPEYIFDLNVQAIRFALSQRLRRKPAALNFLQVLSRTIGLAGISNFLPCCFAVAASSTTMTSFVDDLSAFALSLGEGGQNLFSSPLHWTILSNGDADFHDNVIFFGFDQTQNDPVLVAKVPRLIENGRMLKTEYDHLVELWNCIGEEAAHYIPKPYAMATLQERPVLMISYVPGESLTRLSRRSFWGNGDQVSALAREAARSLRHLNRLTESPIERGESLDSHFPEKVDKFRELFQVTPEEDQLLSDLVKTMENSIATANHKVLIQGDFWHGNMIRDEKHGKLMFVDWQFARWSVDASMDVYFFLLAGALSAAENGGAEQRAQDAFCLLSGWRADIIPEYLSTYGKPDHYLLLPQKHGMMMCCVEKAVRSALEFGYSHSDDLMWRYLFAELLNWQDEN